MDEQSEHDEARDGIDENGRGQSGSHDEAVKQTGKKALIIDSDGFVRDVGGGAWRTYDPRDDQ